MTPERTPHRASILALAATAVALSALTGVGFAMWTRYGDRMFMAIVENGLAWCY